MPNKIADYVFAFRIYAHEFDLNFHAFDAFAFVERVRLFTFENRK